MLELDELENSDFTTEESVVKCEKNQTSYLKNLLLNREYNDDDDFNKDQENSDDEEGTTDETYHLYGAVTTTLQVNV